LRFSRPVAYLRKHYIIATAGIRREIYSDSTAPICAAATNVYRHRIFQDTILHQHQYGRPQKLQETRKYEIQRNLTHSDYSCNPPHRVVSKPGPNEQKDNPNLALNSPHPYPLAWRLPLYAARWKHCIIFFETTVTRRPICQIQRSSGDDILQFAF